MKRVILMQTGGSALTTWEEFVQLPDEAEGTHCELHDGEVVIVPPAKPFHTYMQRSEERRVGKEARARGTAKREKHNRPAANLQYWIADAAYWPNEDLE